MTALDRLLHPSPPSTPPSAERVPVDADDPDALALERQRLGDLAALRRAEAAAFAAIADGERPPGARPALLGWPPAPDRVDAMLASRPDWARSAAVSRAREADALDDRIADFAAQEASLRRARSTPSPLVPQPPRRRSA